MTLGEDSTKQEFITFKMLFKLLSLIWEIFLPSTNRQLHPQIIIRDQKNNSHHLYLDTFEF
jgi:hypothetical protein